MRDSKLWEVSHLFRREISIRMVISRDKNWSPNMILTAFDGKFDEKKDEIPPGAVDLQIS